MRGTSTSVPLTLAGTRQSVPKKLTGGFTPQAGAEQSGALLAPSWPSSAPAAEPAEMLPGWGFGVSRGACRETGPKDVRGGNPSGLHTLQMRKESMHEEMQKQEAFLSRWSVLHRARRTGLRGTYGRRDGLELSLI